MSRLSTITLISSMLLGVTFHCTVIAHAATPAEAWQKQAGDSQEPEAEQDEADDVGMPVPFQDGNGSPHVDANFFDALFDAPVAKTEQAQGFYAKGSLVEPSRFPLDGKGFLKILRPRQRWYATSDYVDMIEKLTGEMHDLFPGGERLQLGDIAGIHGGPISGHASHQNGLDGDLVYFRNNHFEQDPNDATGMHELFVADGKVTANFDTKRNWIFINHIYETGRLVRIFMDPVIKAEFCSYAKSIGDFNAEGIEILRHLRPLANHQNHMHVRITCPADDKACISQAVVPPGSGCPGSDK